MDIGEYSRRAMTTLTADHSYGDVDPRLMAQVLGLAGESGEVLEKFKKILRDKAGKLDDGDKAEIAKELGDVLWYVNSVATLLGTDLESIATGNLAKLASRQQRSRLHGSGDNR